MKINKSYKGWLAVSAVVALFSTASVQAETQTSAPQGGNTPQTIKNDKLSPGDEKALKDMAQANINEIAAAKIALNTTQSAEVKTFAQKMVEDHGRALKKVQAVAKQKEVAYRLHQMLNIRPWPTNWKSRAVVILTKCIWKMPV